MAAPTVYNDVAGDLDIGGQLFAGKKFFVVQRVPSRHRLLDDIKANGGEIVMLEKNADYVIADHLLPKFCPPGSISYEFIDKSIQEGSLRDPEDHPAGPPLGEAREPGALNRPTKFGRNAYTADEDRILYKWVRDCEATGGLSSGNEIYKRLEAKYPSHTWQSWRDRYIKKLKNRPPSAFNIPDNAPPSPPSDQSNQRAPPGTSSSKPANQPAHDPELRQPKRKISGTGKARAKEDHSLEELAGMFDANDWEELYAFVDVISTAASEKRSEAWREWAAFQDKQTAEQWQQYYEKVVLPQWERDPEWKRQQIKKKIEEKHRDDASQSQAASQQQQGREEIEKTAAIAQEQPDQPTTTATRPATTLEQVAQQPVVTESGKFEQLLETKQNHSTAAAYVYYARKMKSSVWSAQPSLDFTGLHKVLIRQWHSLSDEERAPYVAMDEADKIRREREVAKLAKNSSETKLMSSSTARHESPVVVKEMYETAMKRARSHGAIEEHNNEQDESIRLKKRRRSEGATPRADDVVAQEVAPVGTYEQPLEVSSQTSETSESRDTEDRLEEQFMSDMAQAGYTGPVIKNEDPDDPDFATESIESDEPLNIDGKTLLPDDTEDDSPLSSPTPRAPRQRKSVFDTQAILSSPIQDIFAREEPKSTIRTLKAEADQRSSSPLVQLRSDASTPPSIQEFRRSLNDEDRTDPPYPQTSLLSSQSRQSPSPAPSSTSSTDSSDPDPPLTASEFELFFQEQYDEGFGDDYIVAALKRTRMRPGLAMQVLEAWAQGKPLPDARGIWTVEEDEDVEGPDGVALDRLARKHSLDGWGGVTERMVFLEGYRSR
ncbi:hypothetical protein T440DRAFT_454042 [Plenodomus tracheiphilus IPT5]|uniref:DNA-binding protein RAP1 n=1 Tax=Plenodomus tracheiphilus IPT5 TaxID=1408161 RepID=A0A6A7AZW6_9PLEO|nr:hypothetical protein T440DRAFT_454042 [Plenodomus tracheiphilus IPT5]